MPQYQVTVRYPFTPWDEMTPIVRRCQIMEQLYRLEADTPDKALEMVRRLSPTIVNMAVDSFRGYSYSINELNNSGGIKA